ncbi:MAG: hypothetical protein ACOYB2_10435 [Limnohabitans sp.]
MSEDGNLIPPKKDRMGALGDVDVPRRGRAAVAARENPYHDKNGQFCSAGEAAGEAKSDAGAQTLTIQGERGGWVEAAKTGASDGGQDVVRVLADDALASSRSAQSALEDAVHAWGQGTGDEGPSKDYAAAMGSAAQNLDDAARSLSDAAAMFDSVAPDSLVTARDDAEDLAARVDAMYQASKESSGYDG